MASRALRTPLTMAVLSLLREHPRHPYDMQTALRTRHVHTVVKLRGWSLYDAIRRLEAAGLLEAVGTSRAGARPERTTYALTRAGREFLDSLVEEYLGTVAEEYPVFVAGLAHIGNVQPEQAVELLTNRLEAVRRRHDEFEEGLASLGPDAPPRVALLEVEYAQAIRKTEIDWLRAVIRDIESGELPWL